MDRLQKLTPLLATVRRREPMRQPHSCSELQRWCALLVRELQREPVLFLDALPVSIDPAQRLSPQPVQIRHEHLLMRLH